ncbi:aldehyde dehydrogenase family protein [Mycolicibacterium sp. YH-1]|uniref:aldehyde dehydrogenase family protein n=1 Tax=Mycolicibacterium sp. YH-1 TaxID=2908837 RepID=UPI001F4BD387|nr:aldehyde dehydrogenase family protein [Mycolicibacterium sp. YH-1]UNB52885.1 aldehyde dehydrogenase family protein [Mycolicibacterium sp. YH-1]
MTQIDTGTSNMQSDLRTQAFIGGTFVDAEGGALMPAWSPSTGQRIAEVANCSAHDVERAVSVARVAFDKGSWSRAPLEFRKQVMHRFADLVESHSAELSYLDSLNAGKPITACSTGDLPDAVATLRWYAEVIDKVYGRVSPNTGDGIGIITREPVGVVGSVIPWNYPCATLAWKLGPALACGNSVVVKPAEQAPLSAIRIAELAVEAGLPNGVLNVVPGVGEIAGRQVGMSLGVDALSFTGSTATGRRFLEYAAASNLKMVSLECGGKSPQIVLADAVADLDYLVDQLAIAAFTNSGQNCTAGSRILVDESVHDLVVAALAARVATEVVGPALDPATTIGPVIEQRAMVRVLEAAEEARAGGATVVSGGRQALSESGGWFVEPTILAGVASDMRVAREELFGPLVAVLPFTDHAEAIAMANDTSYGLAASLYTNDIDRATEIATSIRAGTVSINSYSEGDITTPFGGYGLSGFGGREKGTDALAQYSELKTIWLTRRPR